MKKIKPYLPLLIMVGVVLLVGSAEASSVVAGKTRTWPWDTFLKSVAMELTGPLPFILGIIGIAAASFALISGVVPGHAMQKVFLILVHTNSICHCHFVT